jgi:hypothetical protein
VSPQTCHRDVRQTGVSRRVAGGQAQNVRFPCLVMALDPVGPSQIDIILAISNNHVRIARAVSGQSTRSNLAWKKRNCAGS